MAASKSTLPALVLGAIGIVYGDIGTSVLYALKEVFAAGHVPFTAHNVYGILSLLFWTLTVIVSFKYVLLVLRADNNGEGGMVAMLALASDAVRSHPRTRAALLAVGIFGTALFYGDGVITPAISVLSAVEGLELATPAFRPYAIPLTLAVLLGLFLVQRHGTGGIARYFGPITLLWFAAIAALGAHEIAGHPAVLRALDPRYALSFIAAQPGIAFLALSALVLCVTGAEALYADMGHFGRRPIRVAWFAVVMPALVLNYFGQGALLLRDPQALRNPFFLLAPQWLLLPMVALATLATIIASQALISGAFSVTKQVIQLGYLPRLRILHTSAEQIGQVYIPFVNWALFAAIAMAVVTFKTSGALASAYGIAVCGLMLITTMLTFFVIRRKWRLPILVCVGATGFFFLVDLAFLLSALLKFLSGGWFPIAVALALFMAMMTWREGYRTLARKRREMAVDLAPFIESVFLDPPARVPGTAVFLTEEPDKVPATLLHNLKHNKVLHEHNLFVTLRYHERPWIGLDERCEVASLGRHCWAVTLHYGFKNDPDVPLALENIRGRGFEVERMSTSYFVGRDHVAAVPQRGGMPFWRKKLFAQMHRNAGAVSDFLNLPANAVVELGAKVEV